MSHSSTTGIRAQRRKRAESDPERESKQPQPPPTDSPSPADAPFSTPSTVTELSDDLISMISPYFKDDRERLSGEDFRDLAKVLMFCDMERYAESPRLFWMFYGIKRLDLLDYILDTGGSDYTLPIRPPDGMSELLSALLMKRQKSLSIERLEKGVHGIFEQEEAQISVIGEPEHTFKLWIGFEVRVLKSTWYNGERVAVKVIKRNYSRPRNNTWESSFTVASEIRLMSRMAHRHCAQYMGSYSTFANFGIISPRIDNVLEAYLEPDVLLQNISSIQRWFGCLATAVEYLHRNNICSHSNINPLSVFIRSDSVILSNFEKSFVVTDSPAGVSQSQFLASGHIYPSNPGDFHYAADMKALGMVYLLMLSTITGHGDVYRTIINNIKDAYHQRSKIQLLLLELAIENPLSMPNLGFVNELPGLQNTSLPRFIECLIFADVLVQPTASKTSFYFREVGQSRVEWCGKCCSKSPSDQKSSNLNGSYCLGALPAVITPVLPSGPYTIGSHFPRTYMLLSQMKRLDLISTMLRSGVSDIWLPYKQSLLRQLLNDSSLVKEFYTQQELVLSPVFQDEKHHHFLNGEEHFETVKELGSGGYGSVWHVIDPRTKQHLAKKLIPRVHILSKGRAREVADIVEREINVLKRVTDMRHRHIVSIVGSYTDLEDFAILFSPLADMNLGEYMETEAPKGIMWKWFGCLATALEFLHSMKIRHKDIKPQNILVHGKNVLLTDFGISNDWSSLAAPTTSGPGARDPRYCAPEVAEWDKRNESADIFSLGCVFLEMITVLCGSKISDIRAFFASNGTEHTWYHRNQYALTHWMKHYGTLRLNTNSYVWPFRQVSLMVLWNRDSRIGSQALVKSMRNSLNWKNRGFCDECCKEMT
ncbi:kinase-like domain-containing protein [Dendryphion nanum]|uniref:Kinase-like domain-containing protein n=1 Tax=Dendryphion nanum TaxID=256645 RepID=A0A9P9IKC6_9PLEO|nr:kinase-like domain-containing protein [Dendryphion nanum]